MTMDSKGISPMIAVVLLIAFTVAVGGIVSIWLTGFAGTTTSSVESASTNQTKCSGTYIDVVSVNNDTILLTNRGAQTIEDIKCFTANGSVIGVLDGGTTDDLPSGSMLNSATWNSSVLETDTDIGYLAAYGSSVICSGTCLNIGVTGECKSGQSCWGL